MHNDIDKQIGIVWLDMGDDRYTKAYTTKSAKNNRYALRVENNYEKL